MLAREGPLLQSYTMKGEKGKWVVEVSDWSESPPVVIQLARGDSASWLLFINIAPLQFPLSQLHLLVSIKPGDDSDLYLVNTYLSSEELPVDPISY
jgi:hypothetical protein